MNALPYTYASALSVRGTTHERNEDRFTVLDGHVPEVRATRRGALFAVADGVSSSRDGHRAAEVTCETLRRFFSTARQASEDLLLDLVESADAEVRMTVGGACTLAGIWLAGRRLHVFSLGDSAVYRIRGRRLQQLTKPPRSTGLTTYVGMGEAVRPCVSLRRYAPQAGDTYLVFSDGLTAALDSDALAQVARRAADPAAVIAAVNRTLDRGPHPDDVTLIAVEILALEASDAQVRAMTRVGPRLSEAAAR